MDTREDLINMRNNLLRRANLINEVLYFEFGEISDNALSNHKESPEINIFPIKSSLEKQILWLFDNVFKKSVKLREVQVKLSFFKNQIIKPDNAVRKLRKQGKLVMVTYDEKAISSWWGKSEWVSKNDFKNEFRSNDSPETLISKVIRS